MRFRVLYSISLLLIVGCVCLFWGCRDPDAADLIIVGGKVYTLNPKQPAAQAVVVHGDRIVFVGERDEALRYEGAETRVLDVAGATVLPGLIDSHAHLASLGRYLSQLRLVGTTSANQVRDMVLARQTEMAPGSWVLGRGWDQNDWANKQFPTYKDLAGSEANPVYLRRVGGHAAWVNRTALDVGGITRDTPDPMGGRIVRDEDGEATGILIDAARDLVSEKIPKPSLEEQTRRIRLAIEECHRHGLTGVHDAGVTEETLSIFETLLAANELTLRVYTMLDSDEEAFVVEQMQRGPRVDAGYFLNVRGVKVYADGALGSRGALLLEPYSDDPSQLGLLRHPRETFERWTERALTSGFQLCTHAIGDGGNRLILDVYQAMIGQYNATNHRLRIEHAQVLALEDVDRFAELGVVAAMQPTHATSDMYWASDRIGEKRVKGAYAWRRLLDAGAVVACGSDFPVEAVSPLWGVYAAVTRQDHEGWPEGGWTPGERMSLDEAIAGFTIQAAFAEFAEHMKGTIEAFKLADFTVLNRDPFEIPPKEILATTVAYTIVAGRVVYEATE